MKLKLFILIVLFLCLIVLGSRHSVKAVEPTNVLATHQMSLDDRYSNTMVNDVFKDNILLTMAYMRGIVKNPQAPDWNDVQKPFHYEMVLQPNQTFAFHDSVLPAYEGKVARTTAAHFDGAQGFKSDGYLMGDGVCHLASLINWAAKDAKLEVYAPTNHDFAVIPEVPKEFGVAIYDSPNESGSVNGMENLYVTNNKSKPVTFVFDYRNDVLSVTVSESK
ncbi:MAG TPA: VanW family protein [Candidatus Saccharimonadales bacterium]|nr:VanW family protein [Candidatus Saccharimonadales bacterium]